MSAADIFTVVIVNGKPSYSKCDTVPKDFFKQIVLDGQSELSVSVTLYFAWWLTNGIPL
jgi:hypothetical protein